MEVLGPDVGQLLDFLPNQGTDGFIGKWDADVPFTFPQRAGIGIAYRPWDRWLIVFDVTWIDWTDFLGDWVVKLSNGDNTDLNTIIGSSGFSSGIPQDWEEGVIFSVGMEYKLSETTVLRAGFAHGNNVVPSDTVVPTGPAINENHLTAGWGYRRKSFGFDLAYEHIFDNSSSRVPHHQVAREFDNSRTSVSANILHMMCTWHF